MKYTATLPLALALFLALGANPLRASEPMTFQEISLLLRTGESSPEILADATRRKLLQPLTSGQIETLSTNGATPQLLNALQSPTLLASPEEVSAYRAHHAVPVARVPSRPAPPVQQAAPGGPAQQPATQPLQAVLLSDRFTEGLEAAKNVPQQPVRAMDAFGLDQLPEAKAQAQRERKPIGFILMSPTMFDKPVTTREAGSASALLHFCRAFKDSLVLVFVPADTKINDIPPAPRAGFMSKEINGVVPAMAVVDAVGDTLIAAVPPGNAKTAGEDRDKIFVAAAKILQNWLSYHPMAIGVPAK